MLLKSEQWPNWLLMLRFSTLITVVTNYLHSIDVNLGLDAVALFTADHHRDVDCADEQQVIELQTHHARLTTPPTATQNT